MGRQNFTCSTPECIHWNNDEDGCTKGSITIEEHCCLDFEETQREKVCIVVCGGGVVDVFSTLSRETLMVELLDFDSAHQEGYSAELEMKAREAHASENYHHLL